MSPNLVSSAWDRRAAAASPYEFPRFEIPTDEGGEISNGNPCEPMFNWNQCVATDDARVHNGHTYIQIHHDGHSGSPQQRSTSSNQRVDFVEALEFEHMDDRYESIKESHASTCRWLFQKLEYIRWRDPEYMESHHGFLWIKGKAGSGKSTLMKYAFEHALESLQDDKVFSFFFHARGHHLEKSVEGMYRSLLLQLLRSFPQLRDKLPKHSPISAQQHGWPISRLRNHFGKMINSLPRDRSVTIYIDALDECDEDEIREAIEHFEELSKSAISKNIRLFICFASRHYPQITMKRCVELNFEDQPEHLQDIRTYIHNNLAVRDVDSRSELATQVEARSNGVFFWVVLVIRLLNKECDNGATFSLLLDTLKVIPEKLRDLIAAILHLPDEALTCAMRWILFSTRPLLLEELYFAIRTGTGQINSGVWDPIQIKRDGMHAFILASSRGLIEVKVGTRRIGRARERIFRVQLVHESVREYLLAGGLAALGLCSNERIAAGSHVKLFEWCQLYFSFDARTHPLLSDREEHDTQSDFDDIDGYPLLSYASGSVWEHLEICYTAGVLDWRSIRDFPLKLWLHSHTASRYGFDREDLLWLDSNLHLPYSLLYILINRDCGKLAGAVLAANSILASLSDDENCTSIGSGNDGFFETEIDINSSYGSPFDSLLELAIHRCSDVVQTLLEQGADVNVNDSAPLFMAVRCEANQRVNKNVVDLLLEHGACAQATHEPSGIPVLVLAARHCHARSIASLLEHGADVNGSCDRSLVSPLLAALGHEGEDISLGYHDYSRELDFGPRQRDITYALLEHGADINLRAGASLLSPLQFAAERWGKEVIELLLNRGRQATNGADRVLVYAAERLNVEVVEHLLDQRVEARAKTQALEAVLLARNSDLSRWTKKRYGLEAWQARNIITSLLLDAGADMHKIEGGHETALIAASARGHIEAVELLATRGANLDHRSERYGTAAEVAELERHWVVSKALLGLRWAVFEKASARDMGASGRQLY
ncbi:hypothetical protein Q7P35_010563 [Cladosporium inversicolor]